jgi:hypothetical protein
MLLCTCRRPAFEPSLEIFADNDGASADLARNQSAMSNFIEQ